MLIALIAAGCNGEDNATPNPGAGGAAVGGATTGVGGGTAGATSLLDCSTMRTYPDCGTCTKTLEAYCVEPISCQLDRATLCTRIWFGSNWDRGCGYVRVKYWGDVGDHVTRIWEEASGKLVYHWFNGMLSMGCLPAMTVGTEPACDQWLDACGAGGAGGVAGAGRM